MPVRPAEPLLSSVTIDGQDDSASTAGSVARTVTAQDLARISQMPVPAAVGLRRALGLSAMSSDWRTPPHVIAAVHEVFGGPPDLDPASSEEANRTVRARHIYTEHDDGFAKPWFGKVYFNGPYGKDAHGKSNQAKGFRKAVEEYDSGRMSEGIAAFNANTGAIWFNEVWRFPCCFTNKLSFTNPTLRSTTNPTGTVFVYFGANPERFRKVFAKIGTVYMPDKKRPGAVGEGGHRSSNFGKSKKSREDAKLFEELPALLQKEIRDLQEEDERSHKGLHKRLDRIHRVYMTYKDDRNVVDYLDRTKQLGRKPGVFQPWVKWAFPRAKDSWTLWAQVLEAATYLKLAPSEAIDEPTLGNGNLRRLVTVYKKRAGLVRKRAKPVTAEPSDEADPAAPVGQPAPDKRLPSKDELLRRNKMGHGVLEQPDRMPPGTIMRATIFRPDNHNVFFLFPDE
jgi:hypothetical protein